MRVNAFIGGWCLATALFSLIDGSLWLGALNLTVGAINMLIAWRTN